MDMLEGVGRRLGTKGGFLLDIGNASVNGRERNVLFRNDGTEFVEVGWVTGADRIEDGRGLALLDADHDGNVDVALRNYRASGGLLKNRGRGGNWASFELEGTTSNRDAVGARLRLRTGDRWQTRVVSAGSGYLSGNSLRQHFGLGSETQIDELIVEWPSGTRTVLRDLAPNQHHVLREARSVARQERDD